LDKWPCGDFAVLNQNRAVDLQVQLRGFEEENATTIINIRMRIT